MLCCCSTYHNRRPRVTAHDKTWEKKLPYDRLIWSHNKWQYIFLLYLAYLNIIISQYLQNRIRLLVFFCTLEFRNLFSLWDYDFLLSTTYFDLTVADTVFSSLKEFILTGIFQLMELWSMPSTLLKCRCSTKLLTPKEHNCFAISHLPGCKRVDLWLSKIHII